MSNFKLLQITNYKSNFNSLQVCGMVFMEVWCHVWDRITTISCQFFSYRLQNGSPYTIGPLFVCPVCLSATLVYCGQTLG